MFDAHIEHWTRHLDSSPVWISEESKGGGTRTREQCSIPHVSTLLLLPKECVGDLLKMLEGRGRGESRGDDAVVELLMVRRSDLVEKMQPPSSGQERATCRD